ncbi:hypothetical protein GCM10023189_29610 [Nibrella saemangeumensis]|uniref:Cytochrome c domain-containing protein n=1 Tax=Nibrella saemangeumensis TaxID=1084526 RepID=A0ABP8MZN9_9BACT
MKKHLLPGLAVFSWLAGGLAACYKPAAYSSLNTRITAVSVDKSLAQIDRGRYLFNHVAACADCHSRRDYTKLAGPIITGTHGAGGEKFGKNMGLPGTFYGKNLTPAALRDWTDMELFMAITTGASKSGKPLFPMMPYLNYANMDEQDVNAIIAYLRTLEPVENKVPESKPNFVGKMASKLVPHKARLQPMPDTHNSEAYGRYLVTIAGCADCHTQRTMGMMVKKAAFAGGTSMKMAGGTLRSANLTPDNETGIGRWSKQDFINRFKTFNPKTYQAPDTQNGFNTMMPWTLYAGMSEQDLGAIYDYLRTVKPKRHKVERFTAKR